MTRRKFARVVSGALLAGVVLSMTPATNATAAAPTLAQLAAAQAKLNNAADTRPSTVTGWYVDEASRSLVVSVYGNDAGVTEWAANLGAGRVTIEKVTEVPRPYWWSVVAGQALTSTSGASCSIGFPVVTGTSARYVATAGHCTNAGGTWSGVGGVLGTATVSSFPGNDYGLIQVTGPEVAFTNYVDRHNGGGAYLVGSVPTTAVVGMNVCRSGVATGWRCGSVTATNVTVCYPEGCVDQLIRTNICAQPGDSGGALVTAYSPPALEVWAVGLTSGGTSKCSGGTGTSYHQPIAEVLAAVNGRLVADGW